MMLHEKSSAVHRLRDVGLIACADCKEVFTPKKGGYNAKYCSDTCKRRSQRARLRATKPEAIAIRRARSYQTTKHHPDRIARHRAGQRRYRDMAREWLATYKLAHGCIDCGYRTHFAALQLDHEGEKAVEIAEARSSIRRLKAEIESGKCVVRCANCHSIRTWERKQVSMSADKGAVGRGCNQ